uniref:68MP protein n=1 Tax=Amazona collaria TaxID=241587 RepID=A0A8B9FHZ0_9PSIT
MMQTMIPKSLKAMKFYFTTVYQEIWVGVALTAYAYYKISYGEISKLTDFSSLCSCHATYIYDLDNIYDGVGF